MRPTVIFTPVITAQSQHMAEKVKASRKLWAVTKKRHGHNFENYGSKLNQRWNNHVGPTLIQFRSPKLKIVAVSFFWTSPLLKICSSIFTQLWRPITMVWNLQNSKTTTVSELPGRWLSHGTTLYRSYIFKKLSNLRFSFSSFGVFWRFQHRAPDVPL